MTSSMGAIPLYLLGQQFCPHSENALGKSGWSASFATWLASYELWVNCFKYLLPPLLPFHCLFLLSGSVFRKSGKEQNLTIKFEDLIVC